MAKESKLQQLLSQNSFALRDMQKKSAAWFAVKARSLADVKAIKAEALMSGDARQKTAAIVPGNLYMYVYDPKHKDTLPYYDMFPLTIPFQETDGGFLGLNLHYLPYKYRAVLLDRLLQSNGNPAENKRLRFNWELVKRFSQFAAAQPCVKHYLYAHVRTPFKKVNQSDWGSVVLLPTEKFVNATPQQVWADSMRIARGN